jgi:outer membrane protein TolC
VLVAAQAASFYVTIRTIEQRLRIAHENAALQKRSLEITEQVLIRAFSVRSATAAPAAIGAANQCVAVY